MKFIDWFAGVGGFRRGMELAGHECVGFCEFDKYAVASYTAMHLCTQEQLDYLATLPLKKRQKEILKEQYRNGEWYANDVRSVDARNIPDADCWCFGFPCQDISVAGKQLGFTGNRSSLFFRVMYMVGQLEEEKKPTYLFIENVKNLLSVNGGWDFAKLLSELDKNGYDAEWQVLNSKYFGVPQNRERCFIIGHLRGCGGSEVFPVEGADGENHIHGIGHRNGYRRNTQVFAPDGLTEALDTGADGGRGHYTSIEVIGHARAKKENYGADRERIIGEDGIVPTLRSIDYKEPIRTGIPVSFANGEIKKEIDIAHCLSAEGPAKEGMRTHQPVNRVVVPIEPEEDIETNPGYNRRHVVHDVNGISRTVMGCGHAGNEPKVAIPVLTPDRAEKRQNGRRFKEDGEESFTLTAQDRHGVAVDVNPQVIGGIGEKNFGKQWRQGNRVYDSEKVATALEAHPVGNAGGYSNLYSVEVEQVQMSGCELSEQSDEAHQKRTMVGYNATLKRGGMTNTALALCARDYKGLSGSNQMMTAAAMCLQLTKESDPKKEKLQTALSQERTEDSANENRKEH